jgi:uncharacterized protein (TIGR02145 family)
MGAGVVCLAACCLLGMDARPSARPAPAPDSLRDRDGNLYRTVRIGAQVWMAQDLRVTRYRDGSLLSLITDDAEWRDATSGAYCWFENDRAGPRATYGALYDFHAVADARGLCPAGWHVPSEAEWATLVKHLGGPQVAGGKLKDTLAGRWNRPNRGATDRSGFGGLPGGGRGRNGEFGERGNYGTWWSATAHDADYAWHRGLSHDDAAVSRNAGHKASGFCVRCVKD